MFILLPSDIAKYIFTFMTPEQLRLYKFIPTLSQLITTDIYNKSIPHNYPRFEGKAVIIKYDYDDCVKTNLRI